MSSNEDKLKELEEIQRQLLDEIRRAEKTEQSEEVVKALEEVIWAQRWFADIRHSRR